MENRVIKSWNEIRKAATAFSKRWKNAYDEKSQAQSFLKEFFAMFGVDTVVFNAFEHRVKFTDGSQGYADCFWQGKILVEMKSAGKDLDVAYQQAMEYVRTLPPSDYPHAVVVSDFQRFRFYNLEKDNALTEFALKDLRKYSPHIVSCVIIGFHAKGGDNGDHGDSGGVIGVSASSPKSSSFPVSQIPNHARTIYIPNIKDNTKPPVVKIATHISGASLAVALDE